MNLTGTIPASFANLQSIIYLLLQSNRLTGTVPSFVFPGLYEMCVAHDHAGHVTARAHRRHIAAPTY